MRIGYRPVGDHPQDLFQQADHAEKVGFSGLWIRDSGNEPFVWSMAGALSQRTTLPVTALIDGSSTQVHPVVIARAAATCATLSQHRFALGLGLADHADTRLPEQQRRDMLIEAVDVIKRLWAGEVVDHHGSYYTVEDTQLATPPARPPPMYLLADDPATMRLAESIADGAILGGEGPPGHADTPAALAVITPELAEDAATQVRLLDRLRDHGCENVYLSVPGGADDAFFELYEQDVLPRYV